MTLQGLCKQLENTQEIGCKGGKKPARHLLLVENTTRFMAAHHTPKEGKEKREFLY